MAWGRNPYNADHTLFQLLTRLFSGPIVNYRRQTEKALKNKQLGKYALKLRDTNGKQFKKTIYNPFENLQSAAMAQHQRSQRYVDFREMEFTPEISSALDIYADEITTSSKLSPMLSINCPNEEIKEVLRVLYHDVLNLDYNLFGWVRSVCKFGDFFLYLDIEESKGIIRTIGLPVEEVERVEGEDKTNPDYVQFQWSAGGLTLENWQIAHFRNLGEEKFWPYGSSVLDPARRIFRQLDLLEQAVIAYRIVRSPERRVFYIDVGNIPPTDVEQFMQRVMTQMKRHALADGGTTSTGRVDLRYNPLCHNGRDLLTFCDGSCKKIEEVANNFDAYRDKEVWSLNKEHNVVPTKLIWAGKTKENAKFLEVELDDGQKIRTTPEHKWILRDGTLCTAENLKAGDALMPFDVKKDTQLTYRHGSAKNFYIDLYHPGKGKWESAHKIVARNKYGDFGWGWPEIIHHVDHCKFNNCSDNLVKMEQAEHAKLHEENAQKLSQYAKSEIGRQKSREVAQKYLVPNNTSERMRQCWRDAEFRKKAVDALTLKVDSSLIGHVFEAIEALGTSAREHQIRNWLNNSEPFKEYLRKLNPDFKNGFNDKLVKNQFRYALRKNNFNNVRAVKDFYLSIRAPWDKLLVKAEECDSRNSLARCFGLGKNDLRCLIWKRGLTLEQFDGLYLHGGFRRQRKTVKENGMRNSLPPTYRNHKVVAVRECVELEDAYGLTVENSTHSLAISAHNVKVFDETLLPKSGIFLRNSIEDDYYIPVRGSTSGTKIESLPGAQYTGDIEDIKYLRDKLFSALKIPMSYLSNGEGASEDKESLSQKDLRFARTIQRLQRAITAELTKIGIIHLYVLGYRSSDLLTFNLSLNNPSKIAELQELEQWRTKFDVASSATEGFFSRRWIAEKIFNLSEEEYLRNQREMFYDRALDAKLNSIGEGASGEGGVGDIGMSPDEEIDAAGTLQDLEGGAEGDSGTADGAESDSMLLAAPGKRNEPYLTPGAKGKLYHPVTSDKRNMGARKRHMQSKYSKEMASRTERNLFKGYSGLRSLSNGIAEGNENQLSLPIADVSDDQEEQISRINHEMRQILENLNRRQERSPKIIDAVSEEEKKDGKDE